MTQGQSLLEEFDQEMKTTRRMLERVPEDNPAWKPHEKSFSIAHLAQLVSWMPGWITLAVNQPKLDLSSGPRYTNEKTSTLLADFDRNVSEAREALSRVTDEQWKEPWSLTAGDQVFMTLPKGAVIRQNISHLVHHRGQLSVYLRLLDVPIPSIYGPTADEKWG